MNAFKNSQKKSAVRGTKKMPIQSKEQAPHNRSSGKASQLPASMVVLNDRKPSPQMLQVHLNIIKNVLPPSQRDIVEAVINRSNHNNDS